MAGDVDLPCLPLRRQVLLDPAPRYEWLQQHCPVARVRTPAGDLAWLITRHEDVRALFADERVGRSHPDPQQAARITTAAAMGGPAGEHAVEKAEHQRLRRLLAPAFTARRMQRLRARLQDGADQLLDRLIAAGPPADLHRQFCFALPVLATCELFGVPDADRDQCLHWALQTTDLFDSQQTGNCDAGAGALDALGGYLYRLIQIRRPGPDLITDLLAAGLDAEEIIGLGAVLFAGHDITAARLDFGVLLLLTHPDQRRLLAAEPGLLPRAAEEVLRMAAPVDHALPRYAHTDLRVGTVTIRAGEAILLAAPVANRDPRVFPEPDRFDITREANPHLSFGHGSGFCLGAGLARVELEVAFGSLLRRMPGLRLAVPLDQLRLRTTHALGGLPELPVSW